MVSQEFKKAVESGDLIGVRSVLLDDLIIDRTFKMFDEALAYANVRLDVIQPHDDTNIGYPINPDSENWTERYLSLQKAEIMMNFSQDRIDHIKKVIQKVLPPNDEIPKNRSENSKKSTGSVHNREHSSSGRTGRKVISETEIPSDKSCKKNEKMVKTETIGTIAITGGLVIAAAGVATAEPVIVGTGIAIAGVGAGVKIANRR